MADQILTPRVLEENPFPGREAVDTTTTKTVSGGGGTSPTTTTPARLPTRTVAHEVISSALNTKSKKITGELVFEEKGALRIGKYVHGVSGDIRITSAGIVMRDSSGNITVAQYGEDGSAVFKGSIQAGSIITGLLALGDNSIVLDGEAKRIVFYDDDEEGNKLPVIVIGTA